MAWKAEASLRMDPFLTVESGVVQIWQMLIDYKLNRGLINKARMNTWVIA